MKLGKQIVIVALTGLEKLGVSIPLLGGETRDKIAMSVIGTAWKMIESLIFEGLSSADCKICPQSRYLRLLSNRRRALGLGLTLALPTLSESLSRSMQSKGLSG